MRMKEVIIGMKISPEKGRSVKSSGFKTAGLRCGGVWLLDYEALF